MKRIIATILLGIFLVLNGSNAVFAAADNSQIVSPRWVNIVRITGSVNANSGVFSAVIKGNPDVTKITATATLYYKNSSNNWVEIPTDWEYSASSSSLAVNETFNASSGTTYKVVLEADVYANGYTESITKEFT